MKKTYNQIDVTEEIEIVSVVIFNKKKQTNIYTFSIFVIFLIKNYMFFLVLFYNYMTLN